MLFLYLDESGDLGFDFVNTKPSRYFTITVLAVQGRQNHRTLLNAVRKTMARKLNRSHYKRRHVQELKGTGTILPIKQYFLQQVEGADCKIYAITIDKKQVVTALERFGERDRLYGHLAQQLVRRLPLDDVREQVLLYLDRSLSHKSRAILNKALRYDLSSRLSPNVIIDIQHVDSQAYPGIQSVDLFGWGIFRAYESDDSSWRQCFVSLIAAMNFSNYRNICKPSALLTLPLC